MVSNRSMRRLILSLWFVLFAACLWAQTWPGTKTEKAAIQRVKNVPVSSLDRSLPKVSLEFFLKNEGEGVPIRWEVNDCGEQTGSPAVDQERDFPMCVAADMELRDRRTVTVLVSVGTFKSGSVGVPTVFSVAIIDRSGLIRPVRHLGDLPAELHRPPLKQLKDLPVPVGAQSSDHSWWFDRSASRSEQNG